MIFFVFCVFRFFVLGVGWIESFLVFLFVGEEKNVLGINIEMEGERGVVSLKSRSGKLTALKEVSRAPPE